MVNCSFNDLQSQSLFIVYSVLGLSIDALVRLLERLALAWRPTFIRN